MMRNGLICRKEEEKHDDSAEINSYEIIFSYTHSHIRRELIDHPRKEILITILRNINNDLEKSRTFSELFFIKAVYH